MMSLLRTAVEHLEQLDPVEQEFYARALLRELEGEERWSEICGLTSVIE